MEKLKEKTKVRIIASVGRDKGMTHPNNELCIGEVGTIEGVSSEDFDGKFPLYYVEFAPIDGYNMSRFHWLRPTEIEVI